MTIIEFFDEILRQAVAAGASDIHIGAGSPIRVRRVGKLEPIQHPLLRPQDTLDIAIHVLKSSGRIPSGGTDEYARGLRDEDCGYGAAGIGRFRVNICVQRGSVALVLRAIPTQIPSLSDLALPPVIREIAHEHRGLVLVTGITGSGKSTTLAAMIGHINATRPCKIVTIEDPIEFIHKDNLASVMQREVGSDTKSFGGALRAALRQDPDVILVGEMRDKETIDIALKAGETGHLVLSTVHTTDAPKTISRILSMFDAAEQGMLRLRLADTLRATVSQRLLPRVSGAGRVPALEVMRATVTIRECIMNPEKTHTLSDFIKIGRDQYGMQTFDQHLMELVESGQIDFETAKGAATSPAEFERNMVFS